VLLAERTKVEVNPEVSSFFMNTECLGITCMIGHGRNFASIVADFCI
jgi:hypothetical protein